MCHRSIIVPAREDGDVLLKVQLKKSRRSDGVSSPCESTSCTFGAVAVIWSPFTRSKNSAFGTLPYSQTSRAWNHTDWQVTRSLDVSGDLSSFVGSGATNCKTHEMGNKQNKPGAGDWQRVILHLTALEGLIYFLWWSEPQRANEDVVGCKWSYSREYGWTSCARWICLGRLWKTCHVSLANVNKFCRWSALLESHRGLTKNGNK